jgi:hypothetical protein
VNCPSTSRKRPSELESCSAAGRSTSGKDW